MASAGSAGSSSGQPYLLAVLSLAVGVFLSLGVLIWALQSPERVVVGLVGRHDGFSGQRLADCLDCHVPFVGTPGSRCLSPGCHGELATGSPPKDGPAMPIRFHVALSGRPCGLCHVEHNRRERDFEQVRIFGHGLIPEEARTNCAQCHTGSRLRNHPQTDAIVCSACHDEQSWQNAKMVHASFVRHHCDDCHAAPDDDAHTSVAGTCSRCHTSEGWDKITPPPENTP